MFISILEGEGPIEWPRHLQNLFGITSSIPHLSIDVPSFVQRPKERRGGGVFGGTRPASWMSETVRRASREYKVLHSNALSRESEVALQVCRFFRFALRKASLGYQVA